MRQTYATRIGADQIERALEHHVTAKGRARLLALANGDAPIVLSRLERLFLALLRKHGLPLPETNRPEGAGYVDCRWPGHGLTVELDSYRFHRTRRSWEKDRQRERDARARGDEFRRYTWRDVVEDPAPPSPSSGGCWSDERPDFPGQRPGRAGRLEGLA